MKYQWILFDADETLFSYHSYFGLKAVLARYGIPFSMADYDAFQAVNKPLWIAYQNKEISAADIQLRRFAHLGEQTGQDPLKLNLELMAEMARLSQPLDGVIEMLNALFGKVKLGIITNGFTALQKDRLRNTKTEKFFDLLVVSEEVGVAKPDPQVFEAAFIQMANEPRSQILMVGDTLASDILGGNNVGIDTCWFNPQKQQNTTTIKPTYEIQSMRELIALASG